MFQYFFSSQLDKSYKRRLIFSNIFSIAIKVQYIWIFRKNGTHTNLKLVSVKFTTMFSAWGLLCMSAWVEKHGVRRNGKKNEKKIIKRIKFIGINWKRRKCED